MKLKIKEFLRNIIAFFFSAVMIVPMLIILINSFKTQKEAYSMDFHLPSVWMFENYITVFLKGRLLQAFTNSFNYSLISTLILLIVTLPCAFVLQRNKRKVCQILYYLLVLGIALPLNNIALTQVMYALRLMNTKVGIELLYATIGIPLSIFIAYGFITGIPIELDEAAVLDGCNPWQMFFKVIFPLLKPLASTLFILNFLNTWNDFSMAIYFLNGADKMPMSLAVYNFFGQFEQSWNLVCADVVLTALPVLTIYIVAQKYIVQGLTSGAVKG